MNSEFESTDARRSAAASPYLQSVTFDEPMKLSLGETLPSVTCAFESYGKLNVDRTNAVLVCHAISGDSHVARHHDDDLPGWWERLVGPGKAIDTDRYFVICPNVLGSCRGSTGPSSIDPTTGKPYGRAFPQITIEDMVDVQKRLIDHLGIGQLLGIVGGSLGGHQALNWATRYPDRLAACCAIATSTRLTSQAIAFDVIGRNAILSDPDFHQGQYYDKAQKPEVGLAIARMLGHITYLSSEAMAEKFEIDRHHPRNLDTMFEKRFSVGSYLAYQGHKFVERFDANSYLTLSMAMDLMDLGSTQQALRESLASAQCRWLVVSFSSDWLFPPWQSRELVRALNALDQPTSYAEITTSAGHDSFLIEKDIDQYANLIRSTLEPPTGKATDYPPRLDDQRIIELIEPGESVLDLGCGDGSLLAALRARGAKHLQGIEISLEPLEQTSSRGLLVQQHDLDEGRLEFPDGRFDVAVLSATLQAVANIEPLLDEMLRVARRSILSFANFAFRDLRDMYAQKGRSPKADGQYRHEWFNTPNRRFPSIVDVLDLLKRKDALVHQAIYLETATGRQVSENEDFNYLADTAILVITRNH